MEEVFHNATVVTPVIAVDDNGLEYDADNHEVTEGEVYAYQCAECGVYFSDEDDRVIETSMELAKYVKRGYPSMPQDEILGSLRYAFKHIKECRGTAEGQEFNEKYTNILNCLSTLYDKHVASIKDAIKQLEDQLAMEDDRHVCASLEISIQRLEGELPSDKNAKLEV